MALLAILDVLLRFSAKNLFHSRAWRSPQQCCSR
jgi:hypothetical protein